MQNEIEKKEDHFTEDHMYSGNSKEPYIRILFSVLVGLFFVGAGIVQFIKLKNWETTGGRIEVNSVTKMMYELGGKWLILAFLTILGSVFIARGYLHWKRIRTQARM